MATYTTKSGDMWDSIAYRTLGSADYTDRLMQANLRYRETYIFPSGIVLELPEIKSEISSKLPPWKQGGSA